MSLNSHIAELQRRHEALKKEIEREANHPSLDELKLAELKRKKLSLKDEIRKLSPSSTVRRELVASSSQPLLDHRLLSGIGGSQPTRLVRFPGTQLPYLRVPLSIGSVTCSPLSDDS